jgi:hypothetical protein
MMALSPESQPRSFDAPQEPERHRKIAEAAYFLLRSAGFSSSISIQWTQGGCRGIDERFA